MLPLIIPGPEPSAEQSTKGAKRLSGGSKFEIKHKSHCLQKSKLVDWGSQSRQLGGQGGLAPSPLASALPWSLVAFIHVFDSNQCLVEERLSIQ